MKWWQWVIFVKIMMWVARDEPLIALAVFSVFVIIGLIDAYRMHRWREEK